MLQLSYMAVINSFAQNFKIKYLNKPVFISKLYSIVCEKSKIIYWVNEVHSIYHIIPVRKREISNKNF